MLSPVNKEGMAHSHVTQRKRAWAQVNVLGFLLCRRFDSRTDLTELMGGWGTGLVRRKCQFLLL